MLYTPLPTLGRWGIVVAYYKMRPTESTRVLQSQSQSGSQGHRKQHLAPVALRGFLATSERVPMAVQRVIVLAVVVAMLVVVERILMVVKGVLTVGVITVVGVKL